MFKWWLIAILMMIMGGGLKPDLTPMNGSDSNSFALEARKNKWAIFSNTAHLFSEPLVQASGEKITSNMIAFIDGKSGLNAHEQDLLKESDIHRIMQQILSEHVNKNKMTGQILQSALLIYIDQFDPHRVYLLESEVAPFIHLSSQQLNQAIEQYKHNDFSIFKQLNQVIQTSIARSRKMRQDLELEVKSKTFHSSFDKEPITHNEEPFALTEEQLKGRLIRNLAAFIEAQKRRYGEAMTAQRKEQILHSYETHLQELEDHYLYQDEKGEPLPSAEQENLFTIHVLKALANSLDSHTSFYQANEAYDIRVRLQKEFKGIGLVLKETANGIVVTHMLEGGPAARSQLIQVGDRLLEVDGKSISDLPFEKVMEMLHGEKNTKMQLVFNRKGENGQPDKSYSVELKRELIILNNDRVDVSSETFGNGIIGKITLHSFYQGDGVSSEKDVRNAIEKLEKMGNLQGLILDLRNNSGGFLSQAVKVAGLFITNGVIVISKYANGEERFYRDVDGKTTYDGPLIVLTSKATASAAEIVAQALQDYGVALVVGDEQTYGKGTIQAQTMTDNKSSSYFKVTVGKYYTVSGHTPQKKGVKADIVVPSHWNRENIGESYTDSVAADVIPPAYNDQLKDVSPDIRSWYLKYYIPKLQHPTAIWRDLLPILRKNSEYRIAHNKNYQFFIKGGTVSEEDGAEEENEWDVPGKKNKTYGEDDLQTQEAVNILKDMILLHSIEKR
jgi:carboxyl-terminal processing protease